VNQKNAQFWRAKLRKAALALVFSVILPFTGHAQVGLPPIIAVQPLDQIALEKTSVTFVVVAASATGMSYKWYHKGVLISGATASSYTIAKVSLGVDDGEYYVEIRNTAGLTTSRAATLTILSFNDLPVANDDSYTVQEDTPLVIPTSGILTNDSDVFPGGLSALLAGNVSHGSLTLNANGSFAYVPNTNFNGVDSFTYHAWDGSTTVLEQNTSGGNKQEIKKSEPGSQSFRHGTAGDPSYNIKKVVLRLSKKSGQGNDLDFSIGAGINSGTVVGSAYTITMATISNATQGASFQNYDIVYNTSVGPFTAGTPYYLNLANSPSGKEVFVEYAGDNTYPRGTYYKGGSDDSKDMRFEIDAVSSASLATVTINVAPMDDSPVARDDAYTTMENIALTVPAPGVLSNDTDVDSDLLSGVLVTEAAHGVVVLDANGSFTYIPNSNYFGADSFTYRAWDGSAASAIRTVNINTLLTTPLRIVPSGMKSNGFELLLTGPAPAVYTILSSADNVSWAPISTNVSLTGTLLFTDTNASKGLRFYGALVGTQSTTVLEQSSVGEHYNDVRQRKNGAQSFRHGTVGSASYTISKVVLHLSRSATLPNASLNFSIGARLNSGTLGGSSVTINSSNITNTSAGNSFQTYEIVYTSPVGPFTAGTTYYLNLDCEAANGGKIYVEAAEDGSLYSNGTYYRGGSNQAEDARFEIWGQ